MKETYAYHMYDNDSGEDYLFLNCDPPDMEYESVSNRWEGWHQLWVRYENGILEHATESSDGVFHCHPCISEGLALFFSGSRKRKVFKGKHPLNFNPYGKWPVLRTDELKDPRDKHTSLHLVDQPKDPSAAQEGER